LPQASGDRRRIHARPARSTEGYASVPARMALSSPSAGQPASHNNSMHGPPHRTARSKIDSAGACGSLDRPALFFFMRRRASPPSLHAGCRRGACLSPDRRPLLTAHHTGGPGPGRGRGRGLFMLPYHRLDRRHAELFARRGSAWAAARVNAPPAGRGGCAPPAAGRFSSTLLWRTRVHDTVIAHDAEVAGRHCRRVHAFDPADQRYGVVTAFAGRKFPLLAYGRILGRPAAVGKPPTARVLGVLKTPVPPMRSVMPSPLHFRRTVDRTDGAPTIVETPRPSGLC